MASPVKAPMREAPRALLARWHWIVPVVIAAFIYGTRGAYLARAVPALLAVLVVLFAARRPDLSLLTLIAGLPFQGFVLAQLYSWGVPAGIVRPLSAWKEALAIGVVIAGVRGYRAARARLDRLDFVALAYVVIIGAYALAPSLFAPGAPAASNARSLAFRASAGLVLLLLAARHARLPDEFPARAARVILVVGGAVAAIAVYEYFFSASWNRFVVERIHYLRYQVDILHTTPFSNSDIRRYGSFGGRRVLRVGSVFLDPTPAGFFLLMPFAVAVERRLRAGTRSLTLLLVLLCAGLLLTQTRAALIGALVIAFLAARPAAGRAPNRRLQFALVFAAALIVALPAVSAIGLSRRVTTTASGSDTSSIDHVQSFWNGVDAIASRPLGHGLATSAGVGQRFANATSTVTENAYLQVGVETGVFAMVLFAALTLGVLRRLRDAARRLPDLGICAARSAGVGLAVGALLLHTWSEFAVAWVFWSWAGASIGVAERTPPLVLTRPRAAAVVGERR